MHGVCEQSGEAAAGEEAPPVARKARKPRQKPTPGALAVGAAPDSKIWARLAEGPWAQREPVAAAVKPVLGSAPVQRKNFTRAGMFSKAASATETSAAAKARWAARGEEMPHDDEHTRKERRAYFKSLSRKDLIKRALHARLLAQDCKEQRRLCRVTDTQASAWWALQARSARGMQWHAQARISGLDRAWVLGAAEHILDGMNPGDVVQFSRFFVATQLSRSGGLFAPTRAMLHSYMYGELRVVLRAQCKRKGVLLHEGSEAYTTKQCCFCGHVLSKKEMPLGKTEFVCPMCSATGHRDAKSAFGNIIKHINAGSLLAFLAPPAALSAAL